MHPADTRARFLTAHLLQWQHHPPEFSPPAYVWTGAGLPALESGITAASDVFSFRERGGAIAAEQRVVVQSAEARSCSRTVWGRRHWLDWLP